jgi:hypothetical protein
MEVLDMASDKSAFDIAADAVVEAAWKFLKSPERELLPPAVTHRLEVALENFEAARKEPPATG